MSTVPTAASGLGATAPPAAAPARPRTFSSLWYLAYLGLLVFQPVFDPSSGLVEWALTAALVAVFVPLYVLAERREGRVRRWSPALATALGVAALPVNAGASVLFIYAAAFAGSHRPRREAGRWLLGLSALVLAAAAVSDVPFPYRLLTFGPPLVFIWIVGLACIDQAERDREAAALRVANARIEHLATLTERERLSRDLHDLLGQSLTGVVVRAQLARRLLPTDPERAAAEIDQVERTARMALAEVRATVAGWRQLDLDEELVTARSTLAAAGASLVVEREDGLRLVPSVETTLAMALREAVTNVVRHARATRCTVTLRRDGGRVVLEVADDGTGARGPDGGGLTGMRERVGALGGDLTRTSTGGTSIVVTVPVPVAL